MKGKKISHWFLLLQMLVLTGIPTALVFVASGRAHAEATILMVRPSATDPRISHADIPHLVIYDPDTAPSELLVWLPGTAGKPSTGPMAFYRTAVAQGYRVIALSYLDTPAVAQVCGVSDRDPNCAANFRTRRLFGDAFPVPIGDDPQDAIVNRLTKLLRYLSLTDKDGHWDRYTGPAGPDWNVIALAGHSQGGGMAEFLAKRYEVARLISFSGGWDMQTPGKIAAWYGASSATPPDRWYGAFHAEEPNATVIAETFHRLGIPRTNIMTLDRPVPLGSNPHGQPIYNLAYRSSWQILLGDGHLSER